MRPNSLTLPASQKMPPLPAWPPIHLAPWALAAEQAGHGFGAQAGFQVGAWCVGGGEAGQLQVVGGVEIDADAAGVDGGEALVTCAAVEGDGAGLLNGFTAAPCTTAFAMAAGVFGHGHELAAMRVENKAMGYVHGRK